MPSQDYRNKTGDDNDKFDIEGLKRAHSRYADGTGKAPEKFFPKTGKIPSHLALSEKEKAKQGKAMQRNLSRLQKNAPKMAAGLAAGKKSALKAFAGGLLRQVDWSVDWLFLLLFSFGLLKDIFDIAFAALGAVPVVGIAGTAIGIIVSFVGNLMFLILVVTVLVLVGGSLKNRGLGKYYLGVAMEFIAEALPGISWLPWTVVYVFILYLCVLYDRMMNASEGQKEATA